MALYFLERFIYMLFLLQFFFQIVDCVLAFENLLFWGVLTTSRLFRSLSNSRFNGNICSDKKTDGISLSPAMLRTDFNSSSIVVLLNRRCCHHCNK